MTESDCAFLSKRSKDISDDEFIVICARLHQKLGDIVYQFNQCYGMHVRFDLSTGYFNLKPRIHIFLQFLAFAGANFIYVLTTLYGFYSIFLSKWPSNYTLGNCAYNACVCAYYFMFLFTNTIIGTKINNEVYSIKTLE